VVPVLVGEVGIRANATTGWVTIDAHEPGHEAPAILNEADVRGVIIELQAALARIDGRA
jgi:hypothetical protein